MATLITEPNIAAPDDFYERLIELHRGLDAQASALVNAKLILLLANHIGDAGVLEQAMAAAREGVATPGAAAEAAATSPDGETQPRAATAPGTLADASPASPGNRVD